MKIDWSFPRQILLSLSILSALSVYPLTRMEGGEFVRSFVAGAILATLNVLLGYAAIEYSVNKSMTAFFKYVLGGMVLRMFGMAAVLVVLIKVYEFEVASLVISMGIFYVVFLVLEIACIQKRVGHKQQSR